MNNLINCDIFASLLNLIKLKAFLTINWFLNKKKCKFKFNF